MNTYRAIINHKSMEAPIILEQDRERLGMDFIKNVQFHAFDMASELGIDAERDPVTVTITRNGDPVCRLYYFVGRNIGPYYDPHCRLACHVVMVNIRGTEVKSCTMRIMGIVE